MKRTRILLVEDEAIIALTEIHLLNNAGYDVKHLLSGEEAIEFLNMPEHGIDIILMDIDLGAGMDGTIAAQLIISDHNIPVLFLSSHTEKEVVDKTENITSYGYVVKNSGIVVLDASIKMALRLFNAHMHLKEQRMELETSREDLESTLEELKSSNEEFEAVNEELITSRNELLKSGQILKQQTAMLNRVFEILPVGLWIADRDGALLSANAAGKKIWGAEPHVAQDDYGIFKARRLPSYEEIAPDDWALAHSINEGITVIDELLEIEAFDGKKKIILNYTAPIMDDSGSIQGAIVVNQDVTAHKLAEDMLRKNVALQRSIIENISDVITIIDSEGIIKLKSPNIEKFFGWKPEALVGLSAWDIIHKDDIEQTKTIFKSSLENPGISLEGECRYRCADGTYKWINFSAVNLIHDRAISGILLNYRDITERKTMELNLSRSETENRSIMNFIPDLVFNVDRDGTILNYRAPQGSLLYVSPVKFLGKKLGEVLPPDVSEPSLKYIEKAFITKKLVTMEYLLPLEDRLYYFENRIIPLSENEALCFIRDITDRKEIENSLRKSEAKFRSYIENSPYPVFVADENGNYVEVNRAASELTGFSKDELLKMNLKDLLYHEDIPVGHEHFRRVTEYGSSTGESRYVDKNKNVKYWTVNAVKLSHERFLGFVNDITELKEYEKKLQDSIHHRGMLLKELHHRVKNNLNVIASLLILEMDRLTDITAKNVFTNAINRIYALSSIYDRLQMSEDSSDIELGDYIKGLAGSIYSTCNTDNQYIHLTSEIDRVYIDTRRAVPVGIIINELITNVFKYAFPEKRRGEVKLSMLKTDSTVTICVEDNGIGIPADLDINSAESMGLMLVRVLTEQIKGKLIIQSKSGEGTRVCITLAL